MGADYLSTMRADSSPQQSPTGATKYADLMQSEIGAEQARFGASTTLSLGVNPDDVAKARKTAGFLGVAPGVVQSAPQDMERQAKLKKLDIDTASSPVLRGSYMSKEFAELASDDSGPLSAIEKGIREFLAGGGQRVQRPDPAIANSQEFSRLIRDRMATSPMLDPDAARTVQTGSTEVDNGDMIGPIRGTAPSVGNIVRGYLAAGRRMPEQFRAQLGVMAADVLGMDNGQALGRVRALDTMEKSTTPEFETATGQGLYSGGVSVIRNAPGIALSILTGTPAPGLAIAGGQTGTEAYSRYRERGGTRGEAALGAALEGGIEVATELLPMRFMVDRLGKAGATEFVKGLLAREIPGEQLATLAQDAVDTAIANPDKTWGEYVAERPGAAYQTLLATVVQAGTMGGVQAVANRMAGFDAQAARAQEASVAAEALTVMVQQSKLRQRDPEAFAQFVAQVAESSETPKELYIDAQVLANTLNQSAISMAEIRAVAPEVAAQLEAAQSVPGADVRIPVAEFLSVDPAISGALVEHLRESPDAMSRAEAQTYLQEQGARIQSEVETELSQIAARQVATAERDAVQERFQAELDAAGRFRPEVNKAYATLLGDFYATQAERAGVPISEFVDRYQLRVSGVEAAGRRSLSQDEISNGNPPPEAAPSPGQDSPSPATEASAAPDPDKAGSSVDLDGRVAIDTSASVTPADAGPSSQKSGGVATPRGTLSFGEDITAAPSVISLLEGADLSTFIHESGHFFLEVQADLAARIAGQIRDGVSVTDGERQILSDVETTLEWFGIRGTPETSALDEWLRMPLEERRESHEKWARGFERYVMEGKAPSLDLAEMFQRFRAWLVSVYRTLTSLNVELTDDVRAVMDRLLASQDAIAEAQAARDMGPGFATPESGGMTFEEWQRYQALGAQATAEAEKLLDARTLRDLKWLSRAKAKALKELQAQAAAQRREVEREVRAEVMAQPIYQAWQFLTGKQGMREAGKVTPENTDTVTESARLRTGAVKEIDPQAAEVLKSRRMTNAETGLHPDIVADLNPAWGFTSGEQLVKALALAEPPAQVIAELTDQAMLERYGDITSESALQRAADEAVHNEFRARQIATELRAMQRAERVRESSDDLLARGRSTVDVLAKAAREYAAAIIGRQRIKDVRPQQYAAAEARSARLARESMGSLAEAAMHKRNQLINNLAAKSAFEAQTEVRDGLDFFRRVLRGNAEKVAKTRDFDVVQAARAILAEYGVGRSDKAPQAYLQSVAANDPGMYEVLREKVDALTVNAKPIPEMTVDEFRALHEEIQGLWFLAKRSRQIEIDGQLVDIDQAKSALIERMEAIGVPDRVPGEGRAVTDSERRLTKVQTLRAALRRVESWVGVKDGGDGRGRAVSGPFRKYIWQPVKEAADAYRADKAKYIKRYRDLLQGLEIPQSKIEAPELGYTFGYSRGGSGKAEILHAILHTGNASNQRKLLLGRGWASLRDDGSIDTARWDTFVNRMIDQGVLTKRDFDFAQGVWDLLEEMKPLAQKTHRAVFGNYFEEVTADGFTNQFGSYRGGYVPAMMDPEVVKDAATRALQEDENQTLAYAFPSTSRGFTKARVEHNKPLLLDLRALSTHIDKVLLFSHMEQPIREVRKVLTSNEVSTPLHRIDPTAFDGLLTPWMNRAARQTVETKVPGDNGTMRFFSKARSRAGMAAMFANVTNTLQQITGFSLAAVRVQPKHLVDATAQYLHGPRQLVQTVAAASQYMASRMDNEVAQMNDAINDILLNPNVYEKAQAWTAKHAYFMQSAVDNVMGPIIWIGAYNQALEAGASERDAIRAGDSAVRETQGSTLPEDVARIETGNPFVRMFTQFAGYFNMQANLLGTEFSNTMHDLGLRKGMGRGLYVFTLGFLVPAMVSEAIVQMMRGGPEDEDKDGSTLDDWIFSVVLMGNVKAALGMVPFAGQFANSGINRFNNNPMDDRASLSPAVSMIESTVGAAYSVYKAVADEGNRRTAVRDVATLISMTTGLPATAIARPLGYLAGVEQDKIFPTGPVDVARGLITGVPSPESKQ